MLEFSLHKNGKEIEEGTVGNQFKFLEIIDALRLIYALDKDKYPIVFEYFPTMNEGYVPIKKW